MRALGLFFTWLIFANPNPIIMEWRASQQMQSTVGPRVTFEPPIADEEVQGRVVIHGNISLDDFLTYKVNFYYSRDRNLAAWDTKLPANPAEISSS
jgi:hypothetical protein